MVLAYAKNKHFTPLEILQTLFYLCIKEAMRSFVIYGIKNSQAFRKPGVFGTN